LAPLSFVTRLCQATTAGDAPSSCNGYRKNSAKWVRFKDSMLSLFATVANCCRQ
jgi:hypothetical protein